MSKIFFDTSNVRQILEQILYDEDLLGKFKEHIRWVDKTPYIVCNGESIDFDIGIDNVNDFKYEMEIRADIDFVDLLTRRLACEMQNNYVEEF